MTSLPCVAVHALCTSNKNLCISPNPSFSCSQVPVIKNYELKIVHNCLDLAETSLMYNKYINEFTLILQKSGVGL